MQQVNQFFVSIRRVKALLRLLEISGRNRLEAHQQTAAPAAGRQFQQWTIAPQQRGRKTKPTHLEGDSRLKKPRRVLAIRDQVEVNENEAKASESGEDVSNGSMISLKYTRDALLGYQKLVSIAPNEKEKVRMSGKVEEMKRKIRRLIRQLENEIEPICVSMKIPKENIEQFIKPLLEANSIDVLPMLSSYPDLTPNIDELREQAKHTSEEAPLTSILGKTQIRDGRIIDQTPPFSNEGF